MHIILLSNTTYFFILYSRLPRFIWGDEDGGYEERLLWERKPGLNVVDRYAMVMKKDSYVTVSHLPQKIAVLNEEIR